ncbi:uncharacterized protein LOC143084068 [Mytilus galloprovincialis]|uniref:uncharacterized protein LOC143084068 n=1 Tax=Mytilus galloprovincialis TaxID=29158 RepID=UPI003F7B79E4
MDTGISSSIKDAISLEVKNAVSNLQQDILNNISTIMDSRLSSFQSNIRQSQQDISQSQIYKIEQTVTDNFSFKRKGNENQFKHKSRVLSKLKEADVNLEGPDLSVDSVQTAKAKIVEGMELVRERQKLIKMADSSELRWKVVSEYVTNPIADDSEDEKKIIRAQNRAERKQKAEKYKKIVTRKAPYTREKAENTNSSWKPGRCFNCGLRGHWTDNCPDKKKISTFKTLFNLPILTNSICSNLNDTEHSSIETDGHMTVYCNNKVSFKSPLNVTVDQPSGIFSPVGQLKSKLPEWKSITSNTHILDVIENGYKIPFKTEPKSELLKNNRSSLDNPKFVKDEIRKLIEKKCISEVKERPFVVNPLTVAYNKNKPRLVLDCRHLNPHLFKFRFKYEDTENARDLFKKGDFLFSYDLKSAYHHIEITEIHRSFLGFAFVFDGIMRYFVFNVLPFGIATAGYIFTKVLREVVKHMRAEGKRVIMFLDDGLGGDNDFENCMNSSFEVKNTLERLGFLIAHEKCHWLPSQSMDWLGYTWDTKIGRVFIKEERIEKAENSIRKLCREATNGRLLFSARFLASILGQIISMMIVIGDKVRLHTRYLYDCIMGRASWDAPVKMNPDALTEILFWESSLRKLNEQGVDICRVDHDFVSDFDIFCDASDVGFGGYLSTQFSVV